MATRAQVNEEPVFSTHNHNEKAQAQDLGQFITAGNLAINQCLCHTSKAKHVSSPSNREFRSFGGFTDLLLQQFNPTQIGVIRNFFTPNPLPPLACEAITPVHNEADATEVYYRQVCYRIKAIVNLLYPDPHLHLRSQYGEFTGTDIDGSIDILWRVSNANGEQYVAMTELKRPGGVRVEEWKRGFGRKRRLDPTSGSFEDSLQLSKYVYSTKVRHVLLTDLVSSIAIRVAENPIELRKKSILDRDRPVPSAIQICETRLGDSLVEQGMSFILLALRENGLIK
jgi:hypothetical protein